MLFEAFNASGGEPGLREVPYMWVFSSVNLSQEISVVKYSTSQIPLGQQTPGLRHYLGPHSQLGTAQP